MAKKQAAGLTSSLVAEKGQAAPPRETTKRTVLNFTVDPEFRRRFRKCAAEADLKLNELLYQALDAWEEKYREGQ